MIYIINKKQIDSEKQGHPYKGMGVEAIQLIEPPTQDSHTWKEAALPSSFIVHSGYH